MKIKILAFLAYSLFWFSFIYFSGIADSGFHYTDDFRLILINKGITENGFWNTFWYWFQDDLSIRFRPTYYLCQTLETFFFGIVFSKWQYFHALMAILTSFFFFLFFTSLKFSPFLAFLFPFWGFIGKMTPPWYRLGANEPYGLFFLSIALLFIGKKGISKKPLYFFFLILSTTSKESFVLLIPSITLFIIGSNIKIWPKKILFIVISAIIFIFEISMILLKVGTEEIGYAGISGNTLSTVLKSNSSLFYASFGPFLLILIIFLAILRWVNKDKIINFSKETVYLTLILIGIALPQVFLYSKSGMYERYLLPGTLAYSLLMLVIAQKILNFYQIDKKKKIIIVLLTSLLCYNLYDRIKPLRNEALSYKIGGDLMKAHIKIIKERTTPKSIIAIFADALSIEYLHATNVYSIEVLKRKPLYFSHHLFFKDNSSQYEESIRKETINSWKNSNLYLCPKNIHKDNLQIDLVITYNDPKSLDKFHKENNSWFLKENYLFEDYLYLRFYYLTKKSSKIP